MPIGAIDAEVRVTLPYNWVPRDYQVACWNAWYKHKKLRQLLIWHRRAGKDDVMLHKAAVASHLRVGTYWHMLPEYSQARKAIWKAVDPHTGKRRIDTAFPKPLRKATNEQEMFIEFKNGSTWQLVGSDSFDSLVGTPPVGIVFSEWALSNPGAWAYLAPILAENGGWADFITTPRGKNHAWKMLERFRGDPKWHVEVLGIGDTGFSPELVEEQREEYIGIFGEDMANALIEQEYFVSFEAPILGSYWGKEVADAERDGRIRPEGLDPIPGIPVDTVTDIGVNDSMATWWFQVTGNIVRVLDYEEITGKTTAQLAEWKRQKSDRFNYAGGFDYVPHDAKQRSWTNAVAKGTRIDDDGQRVDREGDARQRIEVMREYGLNPRLVPDHSLQDGINAGRITIPRAVFDGIRCEQGLECLRAYTKEWDEENRVFKITPKRNWAIHGSDAWRYLSLAWSSVQRPAQKPVVTVVKGHVIQAHPVMPQAMRTALTFDQIRDRSKKMRDQRERR